MSQMAYRTSFLLLSIGQFFVPFLIFISMVLLFQKFDQLMGWTLYEVALCYAVIHMSFSLSECFARGFDSFSSMVRKGTFDRVLVRPRSTLIQVLGSSFEFTRIGRLMQALIVLAISLTHLQLDWSIYRLLLLIGMVISGVVVFSGIFMLGATLCFWTVEGIEVVNVFTDGGREMAQYPLGIYRTVIKRFFTFIIPFGAVNYYPMLYLLDKSDRFYYSLAPILGCLFILPCMAIWQFGVKHYKSTGS